MRKGIIAISLVATGVIVAAGVATAQAQDTSHSSVTATFTVIEHAVTDATTDTGAAGDSAGDILTFANPVFNAADTQRVGSDNGSCVRTKAGRAYECTWTTSLSNGSLTVTGPFYDRGDSTLAIVGGTGKWATARGQMRLHARDAAGSAYDFEFQVAG